MHSRLKLVDLPPEILQNIFDCVYYDYDTTDPLYFVEVFCGGCDCFGEEHFDSIICAIPQLKPLCERYIHKRQHEAIDETLSYLVLKEPELKSAVEILDLTADGSGTAPQQVQPLLNHIRAAGLLDKDFDREEMCHWLRLALQLLPGIKNLMIREDNMFGKLSSINHLLTNHMDALHNLRHIRLQPTEGRRKEDLAFIISRLLDLPQLESMSLQDFGHRIGDGRRFLHTDVKRPEELPSSRCVYFNFEYTSITYHELSIISARCKPRMLEYKYYPGRPGRPEGGQLNREFLKGLSTLPSFARHLQWLEIHEDRPGWMWTKHSTNFASFAKLFHLHLPIEALVNNLANHEIVISKLLPPSLESLSLQTDTAMSAMKWALAGADCLDRVIDVLQNKTQHYPNLMRLFVDTHFLVTGDIARREVGQAGRLAEALSLARANGVQFGDTVLKPGGNRLHDMRGDSKNLLVTVAEDSIEAEVVTNKSYLEMMARLDEAQLGRGGAI